MINCAKILIKHFRLLVCFVLSLQSGHIIMAQNNVIEQIVEDVASKSENEEADYTSLVEDLMYFANNPLNLNLASIEDLEKMQFLNEYQIVNLLNYIAIHGSMNTIYELQLVDGFDNETIKKLLAFVFVEPVNLPENLKTGKIIHYGNHRIIAEIKSIVQDQKGYGIEQDTSSNQLTNKYLGNKMKYLLRYRFQYKNKIFAGLSAEKDPGEEFSFDNKRYGFDYYSFYFQIKEIGHIKNLALGDFQVKFGQGLILWTGFGMGKSSNVLNIRKKGQGLRFYNSTDENNFMRGIGTTLKFGKFEYTAFFSRKKIDAGLSDTDTIDNEEERISTLQTTGYHRTYSELAGRDRINETIIGSKLGLSLKNLKLGANFVAYQFSLEVPKSDKPYKFYDFSGVQNYNASFDYFYTYKKISLFGEAAVARNGNIAIQNGFVSFIVPTLSFSLIHRYYQQAYFSHYSNSFAENTRISNENGIYYGLEYHPVRKLKITAYADAYQFPWLKYGVDAPSQGNEYFIQANYILNRNVEMYFKWRSESKMSNYSIENEILKEIEFEKKQSYRFHIGYKISETINLRNRIEISHYQQKERKQYGFLILQDINIDLLEIPLSFYSRYAVFDAQYDARIYAYENDLLYNFSVPAYSGKGSRFYAMVKYRLNDYFEFRLRFSQYFYPGQETTGTGLDEIQGNLKSEIKIQFVMRL